MVKYKQENPTGTLVRRRKEEKDSMRSVRQKYNSGVDELPEQLSTDTTERMLSANAYLRQEGRRINTRTNRAVSCLFLIVELLSQLFPVIFACSVLSQTYRAPGNHVIVRYIHKKDGKKNNETI